MASNPNPNAKFDRPAWKFTPEFNNQINPLAIWNGRASIVGTTCVVTCTEVQTTSLIFVTARGLSPTLAVGIPTQIASIYTGSCFVLAQATSLALIGSGEVHFFIANGKV